MPILPFDEFLKRVESARAESYIESPFALAGGDGGKAEFEAMRKHILSHYQGVKVAHTFMTADGHHVDCVPIEQQPTLRHSALKDHTIQTTPPEATAPPPSAAPAGAGADADRPAMMIEPHFAKGKLDQFGNAMCCPEGTIPVRRITLEEMMRFGTTRGFFQKSPGGGRHPGQTRANEAKPDLHDGHRYATAAESVNNNGGSSVLNLWSPTPVANGFSLSQQWYTGGSFNDNSLQTVEGGWQVFPTKYNSGGPHLFIYWTADAYKSTGCYNLDCQAFVQVDNTWLLGGALSPVSTTGGTQFEIAMQWKRDSSTGNWWLFLQNGGAQTAVGYYPRALYGTGALSNFATEIEFGGEVYGMPTTGQMGSGALAAQGRQKAAYQKEIWYTQTSDSSAWSQLAGSESDPACYTEDVHNQDGSAGSDTFFYFGGQSCEGGSP